MTTNTLHARLQGTPFSDFLTSLAQYTDITLLKLNNSPLAFFKKKASGSYDYMLKERGEKENVG